MIHKNFWYYFAVLMAIIVVNVGFLNFSTSKIASDVSSLSSVLLSSAPAPTTGSALAEDDGAGGGDSTSIQRLCVDDPSPENDGMKPEFGPGGKIAGATYSLEFQNGIPADHRNPDGTPFTIGQYIAGASNFGINRSEPGGLADSDYSYDPDGSIKCDGVQLNKNRLFGVSAYYGGIGGKVNGKPFKATLVVGVDKGKDCKELGPITAAESKPVNSSGSANPVLNSNSSAVVVTEQGGSSGSQTAVSGFPAGAVVLEYFCGSDNHLKAKYVAKANKSVNKRKYTPTFPASSGLSNLLGDFGWGTLIGGKSYAFGFKD